MVRTMIPLIVQIIIHIALDDHLLVIKIIEIVPIRGALHPFLSTLCTLVTLGSLHYILVDSSVLKVFMSISELLFSSQLFFYFFKLMVSHASHSILRNSKWGSSLCLSIMICSDNSNQVYLGNSFQGNLLV